MKNKEVNFKKLISGKFTKAFLFGIVVLFIMYIIVGVFVFEKYTDSLFNSFTTLIQSSLKNVDERLSSEVESLHPEVGKLIEKISSNSSQSFEIIQDFVNSKNQNSNEVWEFGNVLESNLSKFIISSLKKPYSYIIRVNFSKDSKITKIYLRALDSYYLITKRVDGGDSALQELFSTVEKIGNLKAFYIVDDNEKESFSYPENLNLQEKNRIFSIYEQVDHNKTFVLYNFKCLEIAKIIDFGNAASNSLSPMFFYVKFDISHYSKAILWGFLIILIISISILIVFEFYGKLISKELSKPIENLIDSMEQFGKNYFINDLKLEDSNIKEVNALVKKYSSLAQELSATMEELKVANEELEDAYEQLEKLAQEAEEAYLHFVKQLAVIAESYDENTGNHIERVGELSAFLANELKLGEDVAMKIRTFAPLHDIGKILIPKEILNKPGKLTDEEFHIMKQHTIHGGKLIGDKEYFKIARNIALYHHEKFDGTGYPYGLKGSEIPIEAQIVALVDVYDALRSERPYKKAFTHEESMKIISEGDGRTKPQHFHPELLKIFIEKNETIKRFWDELNQRGK